MPALCVQIPKVRALTRPRAEEDAGPLNFSKSSPAEAPRFEMDIFDLGMLLLVAAVGGYDVLRAVFMNRG